MLKILLIIVINTYIIEKIICKKPNEFITIFAPPGTGKSTYIAEVVRKNINRLVDEPKKVYCNKEFYGANKFEIKEIGVRLFENCILIIEEGGSQISNRDWKNNLTKQAMKFLKEHRHYNVDIIVITQNYNDIDIKFRDLTTKLLMLRKSKIPFFIKMIEIKKVVDITDNSIVEHYKINKTGTKRFCMVKNWAYFDSWIKEDYNNLIKKPDEKYYKYIGQ